MVIYRHTIHHGCMMLLYSLKAKSDLMAREKVIQAATALAQFGVLVRGKRGLKPVHASLMLMVSALCHANVLSVSYLMSILVCH